jgi:peptidoglycan glycosyltransferase
LNGGDGDLNGFSDRVELANAAYGQAETLVTPLQMAQVAAAVANGGVLMRPRLVDRIESESGQVRSDSPSALGQPVSTEHAAVITRAMVQAVQGQFGQFFAGDARIDGVTVAGKSGTAEIDDDRPHSWFIGFAPAESPRIAIAVIFERGGSGRDRAVPVGGDLMELYLGFGE